MTSDDVPEDMSALEIASAFQRLVAWLVDVMIGWLIVFVSAAVAGLGFYSLLRPDPGEFNEGWWGVAVFVLAVATVAVAMVSWYLFLLCMVAKHGQTPGKRLLKIRIVKVDGHDLGVRGMFVREIACKSLILGVGSSVLGWFAAQFLGIGVASGLTGVFIEDLIGFTPGSFIVGVLIVGILESYTLGLLASIVGILFQLGLFIWLVVDMQNQALHDKIAGTYVVKV